MLGDGGVYLYSQDSENRGREISVFEANLVYRASSSTAWATQRNCFKNTKTRNWV